MPSAAMPRRFTSGRLGLEAAKCRVQAVERHLHSVEREIVGKHLQMNRGIFMSRESEKPYLALLLGFEQGLCRAIGSKIRSGSFS